MVWVKLWIRRRDHHPFRNATSLLVCGVLAGVVVAAASFPAVAMSGLAAKAGSEKFAEMPSELREQSSPQVTRIYASDGKTQIAVMYDEFRSDVPLKDISPNMREAIVAAEDHKFFEHNGVDVQGVARAFVNNNQGGAQQGASTLTMQYVRMSLAYSASSPQEVVDATADTPERKVAEMKYAMQVEKELTKDEILTRYLNMAPFGNGAYGVYAASQVYFNKKPKDLTVSESALLAGMVKAPTTNDPTTPEGNKAATDRRDYILDNMLALKYITPEESTEAREAKVPTKTKRPSSGCASVARNHWGFFCDYFYRWWLSQEAFGKTAYERERQLKSGGYRIVTSLDLKAQSAAREEITKRTDDDDRNALLLAGIEPGTGHVRSLSTNRKFKIDNAEDPQNKLSSDPAKRRQGIRGTAPNTTNPLITGGGDITGYQAGSVFKIFSVVAALENGMGPGHIIDAKEKYISGYRENGPGNCGGYYCPSNAGSGVPGPINMWTAFGRSTNTYFVPLQEQVGTEKVVDVSKRFGVQYRQSQDADRANNPAAAHEWGSFTLGVTASTPLDIANAYATLAADGMYCTPTPIEKITTADGEELDVGKPQCTRATSTEVARQALDVARCPVGDRAQLGNCQGSTAAQAKRSIGHPIFGKSGTTDDDKTASLVVGTTSMVVAGYLVNPDWAGHTDRMSHGIVNPAVWDTLADYMRDKPSEQFKTP